MLVLARKVGETIKIGDGITIKFLEYKDDSRIRVGIDAPRDVPVHRGEVFAAIKAEGREVISGPEQKDRNLGRKEVNRRTDRPTGP